MNPFSKKVELLVDPDGLAHGFVVNDEPLSIREFFIGTLAVVAKTDGSDTRILPVGSARGQYETIESFTLIRRPSPKFRPEEVCVCILGHKPVVLLNENHEISPKGRQNLYDIDLALVANPQNGTVGVSEQVRSRGIGSDRLISSWDVGTLMQSGAGKRNGFPHIDNSDYHVLCQAIDTVLRKYIDNQQELYSDKLGTPGSLRKKVDEYGVSSQGLFEEFEKSFPRDIHGFTITTQNNIPAAYPIVQLHVLKAIEGVLVKRNIKTFADWMAMGVHNMEKNDSAAKKAGGNTGHGGLNSALVWRAFLSDLEAGHSMIKDKARGITGFVAGNSNVLSKIAKDFMALRHGLVNPIISERVHTVNENSLSVA